MYVTCVDEYILIDRGIIPELIETRVHPFIALLRINQGQMKSNFETPVATIQALPEGLMLNSRPSQVRDISRS